MSHNTTPEPGYVYIWGGEGTYKIGKARNVKRRLDNITLPPFPCKLIHTISTEDSFGLESQLHWQFANKRLEGEWFALTDDDIEYLKSLDAEQVADKFRQQQARIQKDPDIIALLQYKSALQTEITELEARRARVQADADEQDRWWAMLTLRVREAETKLRELTASTEKLLADKQQPSFWSKLFNR